MDEMNLSLNFDGVEEVSSSEYVDFGTIADFTIKTISFGKSTEKETPYMEIDCEKLDNGQPCGEVFKDKLYLTEKAMGRVQNLHKSVTGQMLTGSNITAAQLKAIFEGKKVALKIMPNIGSNGKVYTMLPYAGFSAPYGQTGNLSFTSKELAEIEDAREIRRRNATASPQEGSVSEGIPSPSQDIDEEF